MNVVNPIALSTRPQSTLLYTVANIERATDIPLFLTRAKLEIASYGVHSSIHSATAAPTPINPKYTLIESNDEEGHRYSFNQAGIEGAVFRVGTDRKEPRWAGVSEFLTPALLCCFLLALSLSLTLILSWTNHAPICYRIRNANVTTTTIGADLL